MNEIAFGGCAALQCGEAYLDVTLPMKTTGGYASKDRRLSRNILFKAQTARQASPLCVYGKTADYFAIPTWVNA